MFCRAMEIGLLGSRKAYALKESYLLVYCFCYTDTTIPLLSKSEISSLQPSPVAVQPGLCQTWSETPKTVFFTMRFSLDEAHI